MFQRSQTDQHSIDTRLNIAVLHFGMNSTALYTPFLKPACFPEADIPRVPRARSSAATVCVRRRGVQHDVLEGDSAVAITDGDTMSLQVNCRAHADEGLNAPVPYAVLVSLETAPIAGVSVYEQVAPR